MITFETAYGIARKKIEDVWEITKILETPHYWIFYDNREETMPIGYRPYAVDKKDGRLWGVFYPDHANEIENAKELPLPAK